jgi:transposase-like protein
MPQLQLPIFPEGVTQITDLLAFKKENGEVVYFNGLMPIFAHGEQDVRSFRMITSFFYVKGFVQQSDLCRTFGVTPIAVKRAVKKYREEGPGGFYAERRVRGAAVLLPDVVEKAEDLLAVGVPVTAVASQLGIGADTLRKGIKTGRVRVKKNSQQSNMN